MATGWSTLLFKWYGIIMLPTFSNVSFPRQSEVKDDEGQEYNQIDVAPQER